MKTIYNFAICVVSIIICNRSKEIHMPALLFSIQFPQNCCQLLSSKTNNEEDKGKIPLSPLLSHNNARFLITFEFDLRQVLVDEALNVSEVFVNIKIHLCQPLFSFIITICPFFLKFLFSLFLPFSFIAILSYI